MNVISGERYKVVPEESKLLLKGMYGRPPASINEKIRKKVLGDE
jgi:oxaloacetate decarboxylase alpha subunit